MLFISNHSWSGHKVFTTKTDIGVRTRIGERNLYCDRMGQGNFLHSGATLTLNPSISPHPIEDNTCIALQKVDRCPLSKPKPDL